VGAPDPASVATNLIWVSTWASISKDVRFYHRLRHPNRRLTCVSQLLILITSRGLWQLTVHRLLLALYERRGEADTAHVGWRALVRLMTPVEVLVKILAKSELLETTQLDGGVYLSDRGYIMLGARRVGHGSMIHHNVTIGSDMATGGLPEIRENVWIGPDSIIFGGITIGEGSTILPSSVLTRNVPPHSVVQGNPARVIQRDFDNSELLARLTVDIPINAAASAG